MENVYVLVAYAVALIALVGCGLLKVGDILEQKRDRKYYQMIKNDAAFWQMKAEQTGINIMDWMMDQGMDKIMNKTVEMTARMTGNPDEPKEADDKFKIMFNELDGLDDEEIII